MIHWQTKRGSLWDADCSMAAVPSPALQLWDLLDTTLYINILEKDTSGHLHHGKGKTPVPAPDFTLRRRPSDQGPGSRCRVRASVRLSRPEANFLPINVFQEHSGKELWHVLPLLPAENPPGT